MLLYEMYTELIWKGNIKDSSMESLLLIGYDNNKNWKKSSDLTEVNGKEKAVCIVIQS